jgi:hypothetical protein
MPVSVLGRVPVNRGDILPVSGSLLPATAGLQLWLRADMGTTLNETVLTAPNDFADAAWSKAACSAVANATTDPVGGNNASSLIENAANTFHDVNQVPTNFVVGVPITHTVYAKAGSRNWMRLTGNGAGTPDGASFDLVAGVVGSVGANVHAWSITSAGNGWYLLSITILAPTNGNFWIEMESADNVLSYPGNGTGNIFLYGAHTSQPKVSTWADQSGMGHNVSQVTATKQPLRIAAVQNGKPAIRFDGVDDVLGAVGVNLIGAGPYTMFAVWRDISLAANKTYLDNSPVAGGGVLWGTLNGVTVRNINNSGIVTHLDNFMQSDYPEIWGVVNPNASVPTLEINGVNTPVAAGAPGIIDPGPGGLVSVAAYSNGGVPITNANLDVYEIIVYNTQLSVADRAAVTAYLKQRYQLGVFVDPTSLAGLMLWLRADLGVTFDNPSLASANIFTDAAWVKTRSSVAANTTTNPFGDVLADSLIEDATAAASHYTQQVPGNLVTGLSVTYSVYAKANTRSWIFMSSDFNGQYFNLGAGTLGTTIGAATVATIVSQGGGWYKCSLTFPATVSGLFIQLATGDGGNSYNGDGTSNVFLYGAAASQPKVSVWRDQSGHGNDASQPTLAAQPLWSVAAINGRPTVHFDGVDDFMHTGAITLPQPYTVCLVHKMTPQAPNNFSVWFAGGNNDALFVDTTPRTLLSATLSISTAFISANGVFASVNSIVDGVSSSIRSNGFDIVTGDVGGLTGTGVFTLASSNGGGLYGNTEQAEIFVYNRHLSGAEIAQVEAYQKQRYALP